MAGLPFFGRLHVKRPDQPLPRAGAGRLRECAGLINGSWTPLITAASEWNPVAVEALILAGANIHARAGEVDGVCFAGETGRSFADGDAKTLAVFDRYLK